MVKKKRPKILVRKKREEILIYCMKLLHSYIARSAYILHIPTEDLENDVAVNMWIALYRYRHKSYNQACMLAYRTGENSVIYRLRSALTNKKRGANSTTVNAEELIGMPSSAIFSDYRAVETMDLIINIAVMLVGPERAIYLIKAATYRWISNKITDEENTIQIALDLPRSTIRKYLLIMEENLVKYSVTSSYGRYLIKTDGVWRQTDFE